jgi:hypothetical protein
MIGSGFKIFLQNLFAPDLTQPQRGCKPLCNPFPREGKCAAIVIIKNMFRLITCGFGVVKESPLLPIPGKTGQRKKGRKEVCGKGNQGFTDGLADQQKEKK